MKKQIVNFLFPLEQLSNCSICLKWPLNTSINSREEKLLILYNYKLYAIQVAMSLRSYFNILVLLSQSQHLESNTLNAQPVLPVSKLRKVTVYQLVK